MQSLVLLNCSGIISNLILYSAGMIDLTMVNTTQLCTIHHQFSHTTTLCRYTYMMCCLVNSEVGL